METMYFLYSMFGKLILFTMVLNILTAYFGLYRHKIKRCRLQINLLLVRDVDQNIILLLVRDVDRNKILLLARDVDRNKILLLARDVDHNKILLLAMGRFTSYKH